MHQAWSNQSLPAAKRGRYFREAICAAFMEMDAYLPEPAAPFEALVESDRQGLLTVNRVLAGGHRAHRRQAHVAQSARDCLFLNYQQGGQCGVTQAGREMVAQQGNLVLLDSAVPYRLAFPARMAVISVAVPMELLGRQAGHLGGLTAQDLTRRSPAAALLAGQVALLGGADLSAAAPGSKGLAAAERAAVEQGLVLLLRALPEAFAAASKGRAGGQGGPAFGKAMRFIAAHCDDPALTPAGIARACGLSLRALHALCAARGSTVMALVRRERVALACRRLHGHRGPLAALAFDCGFQDLSTFHRAFRAETGQTPATFRARLR